MCHGIPSSRPLEDGDVCKFDVSIYTKVGFSIAFMPQLPVLSICELRPKLEANMFKMTGAVV